jgi:hypothetical protein
LEQVPFGSIMHFCGFTPALSCPLAIETVRDKLFSTFVTDLHNSPKAAKRNLDKTFPV